MKIHAHNHTHMHNTNSHIYTKFGELINKFFKSNLLCKLDLVDKAEDNFQIF